MQAPPPYTFHATTGVHSTLPVRDLLSHPYTHIPAELLYACHTYLQRYCITVTCTCSVTVRLSHIPAVSLYDCHSYLQHYCVMVTRTCRAFSASSMLRTRAPWPAASTALWRPVRPSFTTRTSASSSSPCPSSTTSTKGAWAETACRGNL